MSIYKTLYDPPESNQSGNDDRGAWKMAVVYTSMIGAIVGWWCAQ